MKTLELPLDQILVGERQREDYGDVEDLANSLERFGLIQPIVLDDQNRLVAGGRRLAAATLLEWPTIKVVYLGTLSEDERIELELEENIRRKDMSWQERVMGIAKIHSLKQLNGALSGQKWGQRETGELLGMSLSNVNYALWAAARLKAGDEPVRNCANMAEVIKLMLQRAEDSALKVMAQEVQATPQYVADATPLLTQTTDDGQLAQVPVVKLRLHNMDGLLALQGLAQPSQIDHIITDPPYAIDMDNIQQDGGGQNVDRTRNEHDVAENLRLLFNFFPLAHAALPDHGFCVLWCDQDNWDDLKTWAERAGFRVQRWPLIWIKTDPCQNLAAQYNFTKKTEIAMVCRKPGATLNMHQPSNYCVCPGEDKTQFSHPFAKPRDLWKWIINAVSQPGQVILDPFAGSGTCPAAVAETGRLPMACEKVEVHFNELTENLKRTYRKLHGEGVLFQ
jgi:ParB family chromosome partitioning protein